jgi:hypothetical protein
MFVTGMPAPSSTRPTRGSGIDDIASINLQRGPSVRTQRDRPVAAAPEQSCHLSSGDGDTGRIRAMYRWRPGGC